MRETIDRHTATLPAARRVLDIVLEIYPHIASAVDVGCGRGTWLYVLEEFGIKDVLGIEGPWATAEDMVIQHFVTHDLKRPFGMKRRFDLAICLEVAEHLPPERAASFVDNLCRLADIVLFSAAIPGQAADHYHQNEQYPDYWCHRFYKRGYAVQDLVRPEIWEDISLPVWYRQNILLYVRGARELLCGPLCVVHPEYWNFAQSRRTR